MKHLKNTFFISFGILLMLSCSYQNTSLVTISNNKELTTNSGMLPTDSLQKSKKKYDPTQYSTGKFNEADVEGGCPQTGLGSDPDLNALKNRDLPPAKYNNETISDITDKFTQLLPRGIHRSKWSANDLETAASLEEMGMAVEGYILGYTHEGEEACNCKSKVETDYHLWLGIKPDADKKDALVVEISPRLIGANPNWIKELHNLKNNKPLVRISGWLMWDEEHEDQLGKTRASHWEIHPIHKIEVKEGANWKKI